MTTEGRIREILAEMEQDLELADALRESILGQEFSHLPATVAQNQGLIIKLMENQTELSAATRAAVEAVGSGIVRLGATVEEMVRVQGRRMEAIELALSGLSEAGERTRADIGNIQADVKELRESGERTRSDIKDLREAGERTRADIGNIQADVKDLRESGERTRSDIENIQADVKELREAGERTRSDIENIQADVKELREAGERTRADISNIQADIKELREVGERTRADIVHIQAAIKQLQEDTGRLRVDQRRIEGRLDRGFGANYELKAAWNIRSILGQQVGIRNAKVLKGPILNIDSELDTMVVEAETNGIVTEEESDGLMLLDVIASGTRRGERERVYAAVEVSITAHATDVNRAADRAETMRAVTNSEVVPVVIAANPVDDSCRKLAEEREVRIALHPEQ